MTQQELDAIKARCEAAQEIGLTGGNMAIAVFDAYLKDIPALLAEVERLRDVQRWIPVTERLPNETDTDDNRDSCVLAIHKKINQCYFNWNTVVNNPFDFTHWMSLPEPPTKMKDDDFCSYGERKED